MGQPYSDDEKRERKRESNRRWRERNRERERERSRAYRSDNPEQVRESKRAWRQANPEKEANRVGAWRRENRDRLRGYDQEYDRTRRLRADGTAPKPRQPRKLDAKAQKAAQRHGPGFEAAYAAMWQEQSGCCYLCGKALAEGDIVVDHDHSCCPKRKTCVYCRRGLACHFCNLIIGLAGDDPALLRRIADGLEAMLPIVRDRIKSKPVQAQLA